MTSITTMSSRTTVPPAALLPWAGARVKAVTPPKCLVSSSRTRAYIAASEMPSVVVSHRQQDFDGMHDQGWSGWGPRCKSIRPHVNSDEQDIQHFVATFGEAHEAQHYAFEPDFTASASPHSADLTWLDHRRALVLAAGTILRAGCATATSQFYLLNATCRPFCSFTPFCNSSMRRMRAFRADKSSAMTAPASTSVLPPPSQP